MLLSRKGSLTRICVLAMATEGVCLLREMYVLFFGELNVIEEHSGTIEANKEIYGESNRKDIG